jgi:HK97 gp10 family phage protein
MGKFDVHTDEIDSLMKDLSVLDFHTLAPKMLEEAAPIVKGNIEKRSAAHRDSGSMAGSIQPKKVTRGTSEYRISIRPTGKDSKGVRNMEKMCYLEYGTEKQAATPVMGPAVAESEEPVYEKMQEVFDRETEKLQI